MRIGERCPVRLPDADSASLLEPGVRIDIHATNANGRDSRLLAADVVVLAVPPTEHDGTREGRLVVLGVPEHLVAPLRECRCCGFPLVRLHRLDSLAVPPRTGTTFGALTRR